MAGLRASNPPGGGLRGLPLVETHLHLEGSIPSRILRRLARRARVSLPSGAGRPGHPLQRRRGFEAFLGAFAFCASLLRDARDVEEAAFGLIQDLRLEGIRYAEVIVSPQVHLRRGLSFAALMGGLGRARRRAARGGWPVLGFIADGGRLWGKHWFEEMVEQAVVFKQEGLVAIGLGGEESAAPARAFRRGFERARECGLGAVVHAGEGRDPRGVREVLDHLPVSRIGHGIAAAREPRLLEELARRGTLLEICPTSNLMTRAVPGLRSHPLRRIVDAGVRVSLGSDDRTIFGTSLRGEIGLAIRELGLPQGTIPGLILNSIRGSFAPPALKRRLAARVRAHGRRQGGSGAAKLSGS